jgi:hypothetical protein
LPFWWLGADVLQPLKTEGALVSCGNLPYLLSLAGFDPALPLAGRLLNLLLLVLVGGLSVLFYRKFREDAQAAISMLGLTAILLVFMLLSRKSYTSYLNLLMLPLCCSAAVVLRREWLLGGFLLWSCVAALEPSLWHRWLSQAKLGEAMHLMAQGGALDLRLPLFILVELILLSGYAALLFLILRHVAAGGSGGSTCAAQEADTPPE